MIENLENGISEAKTIEGIEFNLNKRIENNFIIKDIKFRYKNKSYSFQEKVKALTLEDFKSYFAAANLTIENVFGDYELNPYVESESNRLIIIAKKE